MSTVKEILEYLYNRINLEPEVDEKISIYEPRTDKRGNNYAQLIDEIDCWHYFSAYYFAENNETDKIARRVAKKQHKYDDLEADWSIHLNRDLHCDLTNVKGIDIDIKLKNRFTKPRTTNKPT